MEPLGLFTITELKNIFFNELTLYDISLIYFFVFVFYKVSEQYLYLRKTVKEQSMVNRFFLFIAVLIYLTTNLRGLFNLNLFELTTISVLILISSVRIVKFTVDQKEDIENIKEENKFLFKILRFVHKFKKIIRTPRDTYVEKKVQKVPVLTVQGFSKAIKQVALPNESWDLADSYRYFMNMRDVNLETTKIESVEVPRKTYDNVSTDFVLYVIIIIAIFENYVTQIVLIDIFVYILLLLFIKNYIIDIDISTGFMEIKNKIVNYMKSSS